MHYNLLSWDTDFFGYNVASIEEKIDGAGNETLFAELAAHNVELAYYSSALPVAEIDNSLYSVKLVDKKITYTKVIQSISAQQHIVAYEKTYPEEALLSLAVRSGKYSRFSEDGNIDPSKFELLYRQWMIKSVNKEMADEVFVRYEEGVPVGFITVGTKNGRADIGIIAVHEHHSRKGIGKSLIATAENYAAREYEVMQVVTQERNLEACKLYESCGYQVERAEYFYHLWKKH